MKIKLSMFCSVVVLAYCLFISMSLLAQESCESHYLSLNHTNTIFESVGGNENLGVSVNSHPYRGSKVLVEGAHFAMVNPVQFELSALPRIKGRQRRENWCWAASAQMVLNHVGYSFRQEAFSFFKNGRVEDQPGSIEDMIEVIAKLNHIHGIQINHRLIPRTPRALIRQMVLNRPLMVFLDLGGEIGHFVVLEGLTYDVIQGAIIPRSVLIRDPEPSLPSFREVSWSWFASRSLPILLSLF